LVQTLLDRTENAIVATLLGPATGQSAAETLAGQENVMLDIV
jgi:hypothetical protein